ncbi:adenylyltransferase/cytidyltransferase family protein [Myroides pelagicus]|uniref:adenylyltransferase/cytidyltransferase family protein n=1 Tax=Myroides pelagicus TaxID=270914 RepID=UPI002DBA4F21|nr:adenylyltransferase/cytidyltransferase family protein [Myroides pelagicus]MEC4115257.1 adenylyltransferase/cytidyltransferase family protein [Myroides pelagicus]
MKVGITFAAFTHLHAGYIKMLEEAKTQCDYLIVGLNTTPNFDPTLPGNQNLTLIERYIQLKGCKYVDEIIPYQNETDLEDIMHAFKIDTRIIGKEYKNKPFTAKQYCLDKGIQIYYNDMDIRPKKVVHRQQ